MELASQFAISHRVGSPAGKATMEVFLDLLCPYSAKMWRSLSLYVLPIIQENPTEMSLIIRQLPQPWHSSSTLLHEAALAVAQIQPDRFQEYFTLLMEKQSDFFDEICGEETPNQTRNRLSNVAAMLDVNSTEFDRLLKVGKGNIGNAVTANMKLQIRYARQNGIHVTPTVLWDGLVDNSISSSFTEEDWWRFLKAKGVVL